MPLLGSSDIPLLEAAAGLADANPFTPERIALEQRVLGSAYLPTGPVWHAEGDEPIANPNTPRLRERIEELASSLIERLRRGTAPTPAEQRIYRGIVSYLLWLRFEDDWYYIMHHGDASTPKVQAGPTFARFARDATTFLAPLPGPPADAAHLFALGFQFRRAFDNIFRRIYGGSHAAARLRAKVWDVIFTTDRPLYREHLYARVKNTSVLITGETGTGKELVARAVGLSQYIPFDAARGSFVADPETDFLPVNLSERNASVIESELFGHARGAFTGADQSHRGWFERCGPYGTIFLDEIGELSTEIQVKLLRVLQNRQISPIGDTSVRTFEGRVVAATNRNLPEDVESRRFRDDLYFRLCGHRISTPSLRAQLAECPDDLRNLVLVVTRRLVGEEAAPAFATRVVEFIQRHLANHHWRGNMRELELCVTRMLSEEAYHPELATSDAADQLAQAIRGGTITCEDLERQYIEILAAKSGSEREIARIAGRNPRTISRLLREIRNEP